MGFFEKVKNMFTEEVEDEDIKTEQIKKEVTHVSIESPNVKEEGKNIEEFVSDFSFKAEDTRPIFFDDNDFRDLNLIDEKDKEEPKQQIEEKKEREIYKSKVNEPKEKEEKKLFKPTPIISPVYGILDKNYHKEDIVSRKESKIVKNIEEPTIDTIRDKAYGTLEDELENTLFGSNSILFKKEEKVEEIDDDVLTNLTDDISKELDELLVKKEKYVSDVEKENSEDNEDLNDEDLLDFIDSTLYKDGDDTNDDRY